jgi:hypothetical protein
LGLPHAPDAGRSFNDPLLIEKVGRVTVLTAPSDSSRGDKSLILQRNNSVTLLTVFLGETRSAAATPPVSYIFTVITVIEREIERELIRKPAGWTK